MKQETFYKKLPEVPPVPDSIYPAVEKEIKHKKTIQKMVWAIAACLVMAIGITNFTSFQNKDLTVTSSTELSEEIIEELQTLNEFVNGNSLDDEIEMYAIVDMEYY